MNVVRLGEARVPVDAGTDRLWDVATGIESGRDVLPDVTFEPVAGEPFTRGYEWVERFDDGRVDHVRVVHVDPGEAYTVLPVERRGGTGRTGTRVEVREADGYGSTLVFATVSVVPPLLGALLVPLAALLRLLLGDRTARRAFGPTMERIAEAAARDDV